MRTEPGKFKLGAHQFLWKSHWTDDDAGILDTVRALGLTLFEIALGDDVQFDRQRVRRQAESLGIELTVGPGKRSWTFDTPRGHFRVLSKVTNPVWYRPDWSYIEEGEPIPKNRSNRAEANVLGDYALAFGNGFFIHGTLYTRLLGANVTHGCIRIDDDLLKKVYATAQPGTPVLIY